MNQIKRSDFDATTNAIIARKEAINDRKLAGLARSKFEKNFHLSNMRFAAKQAVREAQKYANSMAA